MLVKVKSYARPYPRLVNAYRAIHQTVTWRKQVLTEWKCTVFGETLRESKTPSGFTPAVRNNPADRAMLDGTYEIEETAVIRRFFPLTDVFVDIGANIGFYICMALRE